jgi:hypothetical protein
MKLLAILSNLALMLFIGIMTGKKGWPLKDDPVSILLLFLLALTPVTNLIYIFLGSGESWLEFNFKRKAMEEKKKIDGLSRKE